MKGSMVTADWLNRHLQEDDLVIVDCRFDLSDPEAGYGAYLKGHIPGAIYLDLDKDLSGKVARHGGRHPLPDWQEFAQKMGRSGIHADSRIVAYDDQAGCMAARFWWMMDYLGHQEVAVLEGGFQGWQESGYPVTQEIPQPEPAKFIPNIRHPERIVYQEEVKKHQGILIDSRERERFIGKVEPIDVKAGHIPGACNRFWKDNLQEGQYWKTPEELRHDFSFLAGNTPVVYCGSGVTACANLLALRLAGVADARLYAGSWSDWISYEKNPIRQGEE